ncbi:DUF484 family protein [Usitatibacter palustris]|uniref:DUF484 domain-containing protein n=1 Tax=Usitatibacter palustris TaxID=2732487 RepID=A0A6M4H9S2_9PROT|nr:DUF484 family protein [Usitatibacter palustris]QJR16291.1 hypothetical protein DSM104440_03120 [Usitatibacter palustris]
MPTPEQVAEFLKQNPGFFESHVDVLMNLHIPHPHGGRAVSIGERQLVAVREKAKLLEEKLRELIEFGEENDAVSAKVHRLACRLIEATSLDAALDTLYLDLLDHFAVPHVAVRLWNVAEENPDTKEFGAVAGEMRDFVAQMSVPYCGHHAVYESQAWFGESAPHLKSFALVQLMHDAQCFGAIGLASEDPKRFYPEMGTLYLKRIGELMSHVLWRFVTPIRGEAR